MYEFWPFHKTKPMPLYRSIQSCKKNVCIIKLIAKGNTLQSWMTDRGTSMTMSLVDPVVKGNNIVQLLLIFASNGFVIGKSRTLARDLICMRNLQ